VVFGTLLMPPLSLFLAGISFPLSSKLPVFYASILHVLQNSHRATTWFGFALAWLTCAVVALGSASLVFCVGETRKRIFSR
jgi:threonine/homoserine/homoserine lactone efflux protein